MYGNEYPQITSQLLLRTTSWVESCKIEESARGSKSFPQGKSREHTGNAVGESVPSYGFGAADFNRRFVLPTTSNVEGSRVGNLRETHDP